MSHPASRNDARPVASAGWRVSGVKGSDRKRWGGTGQGASPTYSFLGSCCLAVWLGKAHRSVPARGFFRPRMPRNVAARLRQAVSLLDSFLTGPVHRQQPLGGRAERLAAGYGRSA